MADDDSRKRLGRGLAALIGEMDQPGGAAQAPANTQPADTGGPDRIVPVGTICANPDNPRRFFRDEELDELRDSIREHGVVQPILVRRSRDDTAEWEIIAGERRWRAAQRAGLHDVPVLVRDVDDRQALELAIIENVQRTDLNPVEEAQGYRQLMDDHAYTQADLGKVIGKSRSHVANTLRLLNLPLGVRDMVVSGQLSSGHARCLITMDDPEPIARRIIAEGLSVRQTEELVAAPQVMPISGSAGASSSQQNEKSADTKALERRLSDALGMKVSISHRESGRGKMVIDYKTLDQLDDLEIRLT